MGGVYWCAHYLRLYYGFGTIPMRTSKLDEASWDLLARMGQGAKAGAQLLGVHCLADAEAIVAELRAAGLVLSVVDLPYERAR